MVLNAPATNITTEIGNFGESFLDIKMINIVPTPIINDNKLKLFSSPTI